uniref:Uncharacterized protein n=1 Tax=Arundo donax TaxID=35708 RepID=A0A0A9EFL7_ARUDO
MVASNLFQRLMISLFFIVLRMVASNLFQRLINSFEF